MRDTIAGVRRPARRTYAAAVAAAGLVLAILFLVNPLHLRYNGTYALLSLALLVVVPAVATALTPARRVGRAVAVGLIGTSLVVAGGLVGTLVEPRDSPVAHTDPVTSGTYRLQVGNTTSFPDRSRFHRTVRLSRARGPLTQEVVVYASRTVSPEGQPTVDAAFTGQHRINVTTGACRFEYTFDAVTLRVDASPRNARVTATC
ncbi:MAG: hypothetical protein GEV10_25930 [Streptosporangiales bacterium]|nr:hypothetical protein [Streptosporangiales bacterium]